MLNSNVPLDFKAENGIVYWKLRGADTWSPFKSSGSFKIYTSTWGNNYGNFITKTYVNDVEIISFSADIDPGYVTSNTWSQTYNYEIS